MALLHPVPTTALGRAVREQTVATRHARRAWPRRIGKAFAVVMVALWAALGLGSGTAQAGWPWEDVTTAVVHICGPMDLPSPTTHRGFDTSLGLNNVENSDQRATIVPKMEDGMGDEGDGLERLSKAYSANAEIIAKPTYERYGFSTLVWTNYGNGCASKAFWLSGVTNFAFDIFVKFPMILGMGLLNWTMDHDNLIFEAFGALVQPIANALGAVLQPWIFFIAPIGVLLVWARTRSTAQVMKSFIWVVSIYGFFMWLTGVQSYSGQGWVQSENPGVADPRDIDYPEGDRPTGLDGGVAEITNFASNFVTEFAGSAACKISEVSAGGQACDPDDPMGNINESLWHGIPYQTWLSGELGEQGAAQSRRLEAQGEVNWGGAILNGLYRGDDDKGDDVSRAIAWWNQASYADSTDADAKVGYWSGGNDELPDWSKGTAWKDVPALSVIKFMCNDKSTDDEGSSDEEQNRWMYGGSCDAAGAHTADIVPYYKGEGYSQQIVYAFAGMWAVIAIVLTIGLACIYLMVQKMLFYWLLAFGPIFLAISTFADEKRRQFTRRWFELLVSNVLKQCVAVVVVLFVSYSMSTLLANDEIPWVIKPYCAVLFLIALVMFARPMSNIAKAAVAGDTSAVDRMANAPQRAAANTAKGLAVAGAIAATGGVAAAAAPGVLGGTSVTSLATGIAKNPAARRAMARVATTKGGFGKAAAAMKALPTLKEQMLSTAAAEQGNALATASGVQHLLKGDPDGKRFERDKDGNVTAAGRKAAEREFKDSTRAGAQAARVDRAHQSTMADFFRGHEVRNGGRSHPASHPSDQPAEAPETGADPSGTAPPPTGEQPPRHDREWFAKNAEATVTDKPSFGVEAVRSDVVRSPDEVLEGAGLTAEEAADAPERLITGTAYEGRTTAMDPAHPATAPLTNLKHAIHAQAPEAAEDFRAEAQAAIAEHGVPAHVSATVATPGTAASFHPAMVVGAMVPMTEDTSWQDRAANAVTLQQAASTMPEGHPAAEATWAFTEALAEPSVPASTVEGLRFQAVEALDAHRDWTPPPAEGARSVFSGPDERKDERAGPRVNDYAPPTPAADDYAPEPLIDRADRRRPETEPVEYAEPVERPEPLVHDPGGLDLAAGQMAAYSADPGSGTGVSGEDLRHAIRDAVRDGLADANDAGTGDGLMHPPTVFVNPTGGTDPGTDADEEEPPPPVAPRGERGTDREYNPKKPGRTGIFDYDDEDEDEESA